MELRWPSTHELAGYVAALEKGWSPNTMDDDAGLRYRVTVTSGV